ncbi:MAG: M48 family metallopeptidase [Bacteroidales bacterium]|nr:M48 family metallopeptidase [Bacteroidales bacterium]
MRGWLDKLFPAVRRRPPKRRKLPETPAVTAMRAEAQKSLKPRLAELAAMYGFTYAQVRLKHNVSNWGSCSSKKNINLNINLVRLPQALQDYVMLHELCHLRHLNHGPAFHALLESLCPGHRALARELKRYRII